MTQLRRDIEKFHKTGKLSVYLQQRLQRSKDNKLLFELYPGLAPTPDPLQHYIQWTWQQQLANPQPFIYIKGLQVP